MVAAGDAQFLPEGGEPFIVRSAGTKVANQKNDRPAADDLIGKIQRRADIGAALFRLEKERFANEPQDMRAAFGRRNVKLDALTEKNEPNFVAIANGGGSENARGLRGQLPFAVRHRAKVRRSADIDHQQDRQLALLRE